MKNDRLKAAIDDRLSALHGTPESRERIMRCMKEDAIVKKKMSYSIILAATMVVLLASVALAAVNHTDLIGWLFGENAPREMVQQALTKPEAVAEKDGLKLSVDEYIYDGNTLSLNIAAESGRDGTVFFHTDNPAFEQEFQVTTIGLGIGPDEFIALGGTVDGKLVENRVNTFVAYQVPDEVAGNPIQIKLTGRFYTPKKPIVALPDTHGDYDLYPEDSDHIYLQNGRYTVLQNYPAGIEAMAAATNVDDVLDLFHMQPLGDIELTLTVQHNTGALRHTRVDGQTKFDYPEYAVQITKADFGTASTMIEYTVTTKPGATRSLNGERGGTLAFVLLDTDGKLIQMPWSGGGDNFDDGTERIEWTSRGDPMQQVPSRITLMPYNEAAFNTSGDDDPSPYFYTEEAMQLIIVPN